MNYLLLILTNEHKTTLFIDVVESDKIDNVILQYQLDSKKSKQTFPGKYNCTHIAYYEEFQSWTEAILRKQILNAKTRNQLNTLIADFNVNWRILGRKQMSVVAA